MNNKIIYGLLVFLVLSYLLQLFLPWYSLAFAGIAAGYFSGGKPAQALILYFLAGALLWGLAAIIKDSSSSSILSVRVGTLFGNQGPGALLVLCALIGGITGGLGGWCGALFLKYIRQ